MNEAMSKKNSKKEQILSHVVYNTKDDTCWNLYSLDDEQAEEFFKDYAKENPNIKFLLFYPCFSAIAKQETKLEIENL